MTEKLYYHDSYLMSFEASVIWRSDDGTELALDRTAFYPTSGGQPHDTGLLAGHSVVEVIEDGDKLIHRLAEPLEASSGRVAGEIDADRRLDHMRQHTGQHLLSAVMEEEFGLKTVSFHLGTDYATVDVEPQLSNAAQLRAIEERANQRLLENRKVSVGFEENATVQGLRKAPDREGLLRVVSIEGIDRSACGGTHVAQTGEIGLIALGKTEKVRKSSRMEFYCGPRARLYLRGRIEELETQSSGLKERLADSDKQRRRVSGELAEIAGKQKYAQILPDPKGRVVWIEELAEVNEESRTMANAFLGGTGAIAILSGLKGGALLLGAHPGLGIDCGAVFKRVAAQFGAKGGGSRLQAQGSIADPAVLRQAATALLENC